MCRLYYVPDNEPLNATFPNELRNLTRYMTHIVIDVSNLTTFPSDIFELFPNVQSLTTRADIQELSRHQFKNATKLRVLNMGFNNQLGALEPNIFADVPFLEYIDLAYNYIDIIEESALMGLEKLKYLYFEGNLLGLVKNYTFKGTPNLELLDLSKNQISDIENRAFSSLSKLKRLKLNENQIQRLPRHIFSVLKNLDSIDLSVNIIETLEDGTFDGLDSLTTLELGFNRISALDAVVLSSLKNLKLLLLASNDLTELNEPLTNASLTNLDLSHNDLSYDDVKNQLKNQQKLEFLELRDMNLTEIDRDLFANLSNVIVLDLSQNNLTKVNVDMFESMKNLKSLKLEVTTITEFDYTDLKKTLPKLSFINLSQNPLDCGFVNEMVEFFVNNTIEYEFGEQLDVECGLLPFQSQALRAYQLSKAEIIEKQLEG